jgi:hypothetical protein
VKEAVDDLVEGPVATDRDHDGAGLSDSLLRDLCCFQGTRCPRHLVLEARRRQPCLNRRPLASRASRPGGGIDDEQDGSARLRAYGVPPNARGFMVPAGSIPSLTARHTRIHPPISSAIQRARTWPVPW